MWPEKFVPRGLGAWVFRRQCSQFYRAVLVSIFQLIGLALVSSAINTVKGTSLQPSLLLS